MKSKNNPETVLATRPHYPLLDGWRGVAALVVLLYHMCEPFGGDPSSQMGMNHGYLAVDFFFMLSGFVMSYAYDHRWQKGMGVKTFFVRRLVRLQPMVVLGAVWGGVLFYTQGGVTWDVSAVPVWALLVAVLLNAFMLPAPSFAEVRGGGELYPLNGPTWSLFFEYLGNILYALLLWKMPRKILWFLACLLGCILAGYAVTSPDGSIGVGWQLSALHISVGLVRMLFPFCVGLLIARYFVHTQRKQLTSWVKRYVFSIGALLLFGVCAMPRIGGPEQVWQNGLYEFLCVAMLFPLLLCLGVMSASSSSSLANRVSLWLGRFSYPLYLIHYPGLYCFYAWVKNHGYTTLSQAWPGALLFLLSSLILGLLAMRLYDEPVRCYLQRMVASWKGNITR